MTNFDKESLSNIYNKADEKLIDLLNQAIVKYSTKQRDDFIELISDIDADYDDDVDKIKNYDYLFDIVKKNTY